MLEFYFLISGYFYNLNLNAYTPLKSKNFKIILKILKGGARLHHMSQNMQIRKN